jgi:hypothetical protein
MLDLFSLAAAFRLPESGRLGVIVMDYVGFAALYRLIQEWQSRRFAKECRALVGTYNVSDAVARNLVRYWGDWLGATRSAQPMLTTIARLTLGCLLA